jgi:AraC family transcriptional regulator
MFDRIENLHQKFLVGKSVRMSYLNNQTAQLWGGFMPTKKQISGILTAEFYSMQVYDKKPDFHNFDPSVLFTKWAAVEVSDDFNVPEGLHSYVFHGGLYAVFIHKGTAKEFQRTFGYIFEQWLPNSLYDIDDREHFEMLPPNYRPDDPNAIEEVWIPIILKSVQ